MNELLRAVELEKVFQKGSSKIEVLNHLNLSISPGQSMAIVGESGAGKSTLLALLGGLAMPTSGEIHFQDKPLGDLSQKALALFRNRSVGFVFQFHYLLPEFSALENVSIPLRMRGMSSEKIREQALAILNAVKLSERVDHRPVELSGGEQQRVAIARAMVGHPQLLLADEPTGNLDINTAKIVARLLFDVVKNENASLIIATHNLELAAWADQVWHLQNGKLRTESN